MPPCSAGKGPDPFDHTWNWKKKPKCHVCQKLRPNNACQWGHTKPGKAELAAREGNGGGTAPTHGGKGGGKGGGKNGGGSDANTKRLEKELQQANAQIQRLEAEKAEDDDDGPDEEMDDEFKSKEDWERVIAEAEAEGKHAEAMLKKWPKTAKYL